MNNVQLHSVSGPVFRYEMGPDDGVKNPINEQAKERLGLSWKQPAATCKSCGTRRYHAVYFANISSAAGIVGQWVNVCQQDVVIPIVIDLQTKGRLHIRKNGEQILSV